MPLCCTVDGYCTCMFQTTGTMHVLEYRVQKVRLDQMTGLLHPPPPPPTPHPTPSPPLDHASYPFFPNKHSAMMRLRTHERCCNRPGFGKEKRLMYASCLTFHIGHHCCTITAQASYASTHIHTDIHTGQQHGGTIAAQRSIRLPGIHTASVYQLVYQQFVGQHISTSLRELAAGRRAAARKEGGHN